MSLKTPEHLESRAMKKQMKNILVVSIIIEQLRERLLKFLTKVV